jgi:hypothetical protein
MTKEVIGNILIVNGDVLPRADDYDGIEYDRAGDETAGDETAGDAEEDRRLARVEMLVDKGMSYHEALIRA